MDSIPSNMSSEWRQGWRPLVAASLGVGLGIPMLLTSAGLFVLPMQEAFHSTRSAVAVGPIVGITYALLSPLGGIAIDRIGPRPIAIGGLVLLALGILLLAAIPAETRYLYPALLVLGVAGTITSAVVFCRALVTWFVRNAGTAVALTVSGVSIVGAATQPILARIIADHGWRAGYVTIALLILLVGLPVVLLWFRERPRAASPAGPAAALDGTGWRQAIGDPRYWLMLVAFAAAALPIGGFVNQLQPILVSSGYAPVDAAFMLSVFLVATAGGRLLAGMLFDRFPPAVIAAVFFALSALGALALAALDLTVASWALVAAAVALIGMAQGAEGDFIALFTLRIFGLRAFSTLFATMQTATAIAFALGGLLFSGIFDRAGNYGAAILAGTVSMAVAAVLVGLIRVPAAGRA